MNVDAALGHLPIGHHRIPCPECGMQKHRRRDTALSVDVSSDGGVFQCFRCGWKGGWRSGNFSLRRSHVPIRVERRKQHATLASRWRELWRNLKPITPGTTAYSYLKARGCAIPPVDGDVRCTESLWHSRGYTGPALVALVTDAITREPLTLHQTWIVANGKKADVDGPRRLLGGHRKQGGVIRLYPDEEVTTGLAVAEGVETALAVALVHRPVWSCVDAGNLAALPVLDGIECLTVVADHDDAGLQAAEACSARWYGRGVQVRRATPPEPGTDAADLAEAA